MTAIAPSLAALEERVQHDLLTLNWRAKPWLPQRLLEGQPVIDVLIVGAGQAGLAASMALNTTVAPFILRGVSLLGVDSGYIREPYRTGVWQRLASDLRPPHLASMSRKIGFEQLPAIFDEYIAGKAKGRVVVELAGG